MFLELGPRILPYHTFINPHIDSTVASSDNKTETKKKKTRVKMSSLPAALDFPAAEEEICKKWAEEETFKNQDKLSVERGDEVSAVCGM